MHATIAISKTIAHPRQPGASLVAGQRYTLKLHDAEAVIMAGAGALDPDGPSGGEPGEHDGFVGGIKAHLVELAARVDEESRQKKATEAAKKALLEASLAALTAPTTPPPPPAPEE